MAAALQIWSATYGKAFDALPPRVRDIVQDKVDEMGRHLETFPHQRLQGRAEFNCALEITGCFTNSTFDKVESISTTLETAAKSTSEVEKVAACTSKRSA